MSDSDAASNTADAISRVRLAAIIQSSVDAIIGETLDGIITHWNPAAERLYGYRAEEIIGQHNFVLAPPERHDEIANLLARVSQGESFEPLETVRLTKAGHLVDVALTMFPVRDEQGVIVETSAIVRDITERKNAERALATGEARYRAVVESQSELICRILPDTTLSFVNNAYCTYFALPRDQLIGRSFLDFIPDSARKAVRQRLEEQKRHLERTTYEYEVILPDGTVGWQAWVDIPIVDEQGKLVEFQCVGRDVTEQRLAELALRRSEKRFRALIHNASEIITILKADGTTLYQSPPIERILGWDREELLGLNAFSFVHPDDVEATWAAYEASLIDATLVPKVEYRFRHRDGSWRWLESTGTNLLDDPDVAGFVVNSRDVTERKRLEEDLRAALQAAEAGMRAKGLFLATMSHELRTPLQAVLGYADLLLAGPPGSLTPDQSNDIQAIAEGARRMVALIEQLMQWSRLDAERVELTRAPVALGALIDEVLRDVRPQVSTKGLALNVDVPPDLPLALGDVMATYQIVLNLVSNAIKFTAAGDISLGASCAEGEVAVHVRDTGIGIDSADLPYVFDEFHQANNSLARRFEGAGLGLAIAQRLAWQMGGRISVESTSGVGSTFSLFLPTVPAAAV
jgi:PAS domain S-box-containing protein